jgi:hypothetical protein
MNHIERIRQIENSGLPLDAYMGDLRTESFGFPYTFQSGVSELVLGILEAHRPGDSIDIWSATLQPEDPKFHAFMNAGGLNPDDYREGFVVNTQNCEIHQMFVPETNTTYQWVMPSRRLMD